MVHKIRRWYYYYVWDLEGNRKTRGIIDDLEMIKEMRKDDLKRLGKDLSSVGAIGETTAQTLFISD